MSSFSQHCDMAGNPVVRREEKLAASLDDRCCTSSCTTDSRTMVSSSLAGQYFSDAHLPETVNGSHRTSSPGVMLEGPKHPYDSACCVQFLMWLAGIEKDHLQLKDMQRAGTSMVLLAWKSSIVLPLSLASTIYGQTKQSGHEGASCRRGLRIHATGRSVPLQACK